MLAFVLHAHQPYVRHPERSDSYDEETWYFEAFVESYLPLLGVLQRLADDGVSSVVSLALSPTLMEMTRDGLVQKRFALHLERMLALGESELARTRGHPFEEVARITRARLESARVYLEGGGDLLADILELHAAGRLDLLAGPATHAYLPLLQPAAVRAQLRAARGAFRDHLGVEPRGLWLTQNGYSEDLDQEIARCGFDYFLVDSGGLTRASPQPRYATFRPIRCPAGNLCLAQDLEAVGEVLSPAGYPSDPLYRDFFRDIGWDLDHEYLSPYVQTPGRRFTGYKYFRITGPTDRKEAYHPGAGAARAQEHAELFVASRDRQLRWLGGHMQAQTPLLVLCYDMELLGHRWFEGPGWLEGVFRVLAKSTIPVLGLSEALERVGPVQSCRPATSSGLEGGYSRPLVKESNQWIYRHLHQACRDMADLVVSLQDPTPLEYRGLQQAGRELLLAEASDWAVMLASDVYPGYAQSRLTQHILEFCRLREELARRRAQEAPLERAEKRSPLFSGLDPMNWGESL
ncbi:MAG: DUF1957 domain-containing protein [Armatimonadetes bacterium]|nr:DUF1957 domain-containing protein [Armatimonadota bacterium]